HLASRSLSTTRRPPRRSTLFPYTTLFRSPRGAALAVRVEEVGAVHASAGATDLPVPDVGVRPWKTASVCHCANHLPVVGPLPTATPAVAALADLTVEPRQNLFNSFAPKAVHHWGDLVSRRSATHLACPAVVGFE